MVLSNCARFDIILVVETKEQNGTGTGIGNAQLEELLRQQLSDSLLRQFEYYNQQQKQNKLLWPTLLDSGDQPKRLLLDPLQRSNPKHDITTTTTSSMEQKALSSSLQMIYGPEVIARYLCLVATGLQSQSRRPDRNVVFRPFSSRDAHVMLQLKRTADIASMMGNAPNIKTLLDTALQSGKAAREQTEYQLFCH